MERLIPWLRQSPRERQVRSAFASARAWAAVRHLDPGLGLELPSACGSACEWGAGYHLVAGLASNLTSTLKAALASRWGAVDEASRSGGVCASARESPTGAGSPRL